MTRRTKLFSIQDRAEIQARSIGTLRNVMTEEVDKSSLIAANEILLTCCQATGKQKKKNRRSA